MNAQVRETVFGWNLDQVKRFLVNRWKYIESEADKLILEYRRFMILTLEHQDQVVPVSDAVDEVWHAHLLFTEDYPKFCQAVAGEYLHHRVPADEKERLALASSYSNTKALYQEAFGNLDPSVWGQQDQICWCETITEDRSRKRLLVV